MTLNRIGGLFTRLPAAREGLKAAVPARKDNIAAQIEAPLVKLELFPLPAQRGASCSIGKLYV